MKLFNIKSAVIVATLIGAIGGAGLVTLLQGKEAVESKGSVSLDFV